MKKKFKMPNSFVIIFIIIIIVAGLTWVVPAGEYKEVCVNGEQIINIAQEGDDEVNVCPNTNGDIKDILYAKQTGAEVDTNLYNDDVLTEYQEVPKNGQGVWQVLSAPADGLQAAIQIFIFMMAIGGFIYIAIESKVIDAGINLLVNKLNGKDKWLMLILIFTFSFLGTLEGFAEESIPMYLLVIPLFIGLGYDAVVGAMVLMIGGGVGVLASTVNPFASGIGSEAAGVQLGQGIVGRFVLWILVTLVAYFFTIRYANKVKANPEASITADLNESIKKKLNIKDKPMQVEGLQKGQGLMLAIFGLTFVFMIMCVIPWTDFGITIFANLNDWMNSHLQIITGTDGMPEIGTWSFLQLSVLFLVTGFILGSIAKKYGYLEGDLVDTFIAGSRDLLSVALIIGLARGIQVILSTSGMDATLLYHGSAALSNLSKSVFAVCTFLFYIPLSFLIPSTSGMASATLPIIGPLATNIFGSDGGAVTAVTAFAAGSGVTNLITPTSGVVMGGLAIAGIPYDRWVKHVWKIMLALIVVVILFLVVTTTLNIYV